MVQIEVLSAELFPYIWGGLGVVVTHLYEQWQAWHVPQRIVSLGPKPQVEVLDEPCAQIIRVPKTFPYFLSPQVQFAAAPIWPWLASNTKGRPTVLHIHSVAFASVALAHRQQWKVPLVYSCHSLVSDEPPSHRRDVVNAQQRALLATADAVVVPSRWLGQRVAATLSGIAPKVLVIPHGAPSQMSPPALPAPRNQPRLLFVGRLIPGKGVEDLLDALALCNHQQPVDLDLVGTGSATYVHQLMTRAQHLGIAARLTWHGYLLPDQLAALYRQPYQAVVVPSHLESFGLVALEALAYGVPLVATQAGGLGEVVSPQVAQIVSPGDPPSIARAVQHLVEHPRETQQQVLRGQEAARQYRWDGIAQRYLDLFSSLS